MNGFFGGLAQGQQYREQQDIRDAENTRRQQEFDQMSRMRDYQLQDQKREQELSDKLAGISEYEPRAADAAADAPQIRRPDRHITFDRADVLAQYGGPKYLGMAQQLRSGQYDLDRKKTEAMLSEIASMSGTEEEKIAALAKGVSNNTAIPGKMEVRTAPSPDGKGFIVSSTNAKGEALPAYSVSSFDDLHRRIISGLSPENYFRAHADQREAEKAQREADQHGPTMRALNVAADVAEGTRDSRIAAGDLGNRKTQSEIDYYKSAARKNDRWEPSSGRGGAGGAGGAGRTKDLKVKIYDDNGNASNLQIRVGTDKEGNPFITDAAGKIITDERILNQVVGSLDFEDNLQRDIAGRVERLKHERGLSDADFVTQRNAILADAEDKRVARDFRRSSPQAQADTVNRMLAIPDIKQSAFTALGLTEQQVDAARRARNIKLRDDAKKPVQAIPTTPSGPDGSPVNRSVRQLFGRPEPTDPSKPRTGSWE